MIADGGMVRSFGCCPYASLTLGGYNCTVDLFSLPLGGCDVVLGVQWLSTMSLVLWDFQLLIMEFTWDNHTYKLTHKVPPAHTILEVLLQYLDKEIINSNLGLFLYSIKNGKVAACDLSGEQLHDLQKLLGDFEEIFFRPTKLPPHRTHNHHIPLVQEAKPPNIRPYHYGPLQKTEIEKAV
ncbi:hypothetical protein ACFX15_037114 [Malus domestica]